MRNFKVSSVRIAILITLFPLISLSLYGVLSQIFFVDTQNEVMEQGIQKTKDAMMEMERNNLREKVENLTLFTKYHNKKNIEKSKKEIKEVIYFTTDIVNNLYQRNKHTIAEETLKDIMVTALQNIKYGEHIDYLFLQDLQGNTLIHRDHALINTNTMDLKDVDGKYIIKEFTQIIQEKKEGFANYYWYDQVENKYPVYSKLTFIKRLEVYDWYIGAGEQLENITIETRAEILAYIKDNATFKDGYFFISDATDSIIFKPESLNVDDPIQFKADGFYQGDEYIAYTLYVPQFNWYVTAVKDLCVILENIALKKAESAIAIKEKVKTNAYLIVLSWCVSILLSLYLSLFMYKILKRYKLELDNTNKKLIFQSRQATIGELLPMIAHQWRQPINRIASILALIRFSLFSKNIDHQIMDGQCQSIEQNIEFMSETIDDFTTFYQPKETRTEEDLKELVCKSLVFFEEAIREKHIEMNLNLEKIIFELYGNEFMQVVINLLENAIEATPSVNGKISLALYQTEQEGIKFSIEDNGSGIDEACILKVFEPYYSTKEGSMGLGLYMCKMIVEKHLEGKITAEKLVVGTRFTLSI